MENHDAFSKQQTEIHPHSMFSQECSDYVQPDSLHVYESVISKEGSLVATRLITWDLKTLDTLQTIDFESGGKKYELQDDFKSHKDISADTTGADGKRVLTKLDPNSDEYKNALATESKIDFDHLPDCGSVYQGT